MIGLDPEDVILVPENPRQDRGQRSCECAIDSPLRAGAVSIGNPELFLQGFHDLEDRGPARLDVQMVEGSGDDDAGPSRLGDCRKRKPEGEVAELKPHHNVALVPTISRALSILTLSGRSHSFPSGPVAAGNVSRACGLFTSHLPWSDRRVALASPNPRRRRTGVWRRAQVNH